MARHETEVIELAETIRDICKRLDAAGKTIKLVPTMGCLHAGHASLIKRAASTRINNQGQQSTSPSGDSGSGSDVLVVSIFVNPKQFNNRDDFLKYPNTFDADLELCRSLGVDYVFAPKVGEIYKQQQSASCLIKPPRQLADQLEGVSRPGHFEGMLTVVSILFNLIRPQVAYFGEKDFQQLVLVKNMVDSLQMGVEIYPVETVRDPDQLPLSSRNIRLDSKQRETATVMYDLLVNAREALELRCGLSSAPDQGNLSLDTTILASTMATQCLNAPVSDENDCDNNGEAYKLDYLELRCARHLSQIKYSHNIGAFDCDQGCVKSRRARNDDLILVARLLISVVVANVRLLDNIEVKLNMD